MMTCAFLQRKMDRRSCEPDKPYDLVVLPEQLHSLVKMDFAAYRYRQESVRKYLQEPLRP